jgi:hypothetical protein
MIFQNRLPVTGAGHAQDVRPQSGSRAGQDARTTEGWTPSETQKPWQDRRTLISHRDQRLAILRMVFVFQAFLAS